MFLSTDYVDPSELTGFARAALADLDENRFTLSRWLPAQPVDDLDYRFVRGGEGLAEAATFRAYDAEAPIAKRPGKTRVSGELPPISRKIRFGEYDRLRQRGNEDAIRQGLFDDAERMVRSVAARMELARGSALANGTLAISENGVIGTIDFGRSGGHSVTAGASWATASTDWLADLTAWCDTYLATNGEMPGFVLMSRAVRGYLIRSDVAKNAFGWGSPAPSTVSQAQLSQMLADRDLPPIVTYDARVNVDGTATRVIPSDKVILLPATPDELGATLYGTTAEALDPDFGIDQAEAPGIVAGSYSTKDPVAQWTKAAAIGVPILANPDLTFAADVVP